MFRFAFALAGAVATLSNLNTRTEKKGKKDSVPACDVSIKTAQPADILAFFEPTLKHHFFNENATKDLADGLPLRDINAEPPFKRKEEMVGATVRIEYGVQHPIVLEDCKLVDFELTPVNGGSVWVAFKVQCKPDAHADLPHLYLLQDQGITITVEPPELPVMPEAREPAAAEA